MLSSSLGSLEKGSQGASCAVLTLGKGFWVVQGPLGMLRARFQPQEAGGPVKI